MDLWCRKFSKGLPQSKGTPTSRSGNESQYLCLPFVLTLKAVSAGTVPVSITEPQEQSSDVCQLKEILCHHSYTRL